MTDWTPEDDLDGDGPEPALARVVTVTPVPVALLATPHPKCPPGHVVFRAVGRTDQGHDDDEAPVLAQGSLPESTFEAVRVTGLFAAPVPLLLAARDDAGGIRATLSALVPVDALERVERAARAQDEPWLASVPHPAPTQDFAAPGDEEDGRPSLAPFALGVILRFPEDRKHPGSLADEALDLLATLLAGRAMDADRKRIDNLLRSL